MNNNTEHAIFCLVKSTAVVSIFLPLGILQKSFKGEHTYMYAYSYVCMYLFLFVYLFACAQTFAGKYEGRKFDSSCDVTILNHGSLMDS